MRIIHGETFPYVYTRLIDELLSRPDAVRSPRGLKCAELTPCVLRFPVGQREDALIESPVRSTDRRYLAGELWAYYSRRRDVASFARYSKFWNGISNADGTVNSAYGWQLFEKRNDHGVCEWEWAMNALLKDTDTRQATMFLSAPRHHEFGTKDLPCTLNVSFARSGEKLDMTVVMRSNDVFYGLTYDAPFFITLMRNASMLLGLHPGTYTHIALNMHAYEKDWQTLRNMLDDGITAPEVPLPRQALPWVNISGDATAAFVHRRDPLARHLAEVGAWPS